MIKLVIIYGVIFPPKESILRLPTSLCNLSKFIIRVFQFNKCFSHGCFLTHFMRLVSSDTPWKHQKTFGVAQRYSVKQVFLEISQNSQENTCTRVCFFNKVAALRPATLLKKRLWHRCFPVNLFKNIFLLELALRLPFHSNTSPGGVL